MNRFGGEWTVRKLEALKKYLNAYKRIFDGNERARFFRTIYIDGFAGSGGWVAREQSESVEQQGLFETHYESADASNYAAGSVKTALGIDSPFDEYILIEKNPKTAAELRCMIESEFGSFLKSCHIAVGDCNNKLCEIADNWNYKRDRAVCFLDPYGMSVKWSTLESIARTKAIDMWLLFPLGQGVCRLLKKKEIPDDAWAEKLDDVLGTQDWRGAFYRRKESNTLFGDKFEIERCVGVEQIGEYFLKRLRSIFEGVSEKPMILRNSRNSPIFMLCFAAGNKKGSVPALRIANSITGKA